MKIEEPKTPYSYYEDSIENASFEQGASSNIDLERLVKDIDQHRPAKVMEPPDIDEEDDDENLSEEEKMKRREFETKRKKHYNEFQAVKLARKLLEEEEEADDDENDKAKGEVANKSDDQIDDFNLDSNTEDIDESSKDIDLNT